MNYFKKWRNYPRSFKQQLLKIAGYSLWMEINLKVKNFTKFQDLKDNLPESDVQLLTEQEKMEVRRMAKIMRILERRAPWKPMCYNRAIIAKKLLRAKGIETTLHIGFKPRKGEENFEGHAWLTIGQFFITGKIPQLPQYKELKPIINPTKEQNA